jgi:hypothetical protein
MAILLPALALVGWTMAVLLLMPYKLFKAVFERQLSLDDLQLGVGGSANVPAGISIPNRNFMNLLEIPVLFYVLCITLYVTQQADALAVTLAWAYVGLRVLHSLVHLTYNKVLHRVSVYAASNLVLFVMWVLALGIFSGVAQADDGSARTATALEPMVVTPQISPLDEPYERLRRMMNDPYCDGCPPLIEVDRESVYLKAMKPVQWLTGYGLHVPEISHEDRLDLHLAHDWRMYERIPEN